MSLLIDFATMKGFAESRCVTEAASNIATPKADVSRLYSVKMESKLDSAFISLDCHMENAINALLIASILRYISTAFKQINYLETTLVDLQLLNHGNNRN